MAVSIKTAMATIVEQVDKRVEKLIADHRRISQLNRKLLQEREKLKETKRELQQQLQQQQREIDKLTLQRGLENATQDPKRATAYVNRLMREVDSCIKIISQVQPQGEQ